MDSVHDEQNMTSVGLLHSDIPGSKLDCSSPRLFAAYHVLHRLSMPRHPSCALSSLTTRKIKISLCSQLSFFFAVISSRHYFSSIVNQPRDLIAAYENLSRGIIRSSCRFELVGVLGFEPRTSSLSGTRSNQLSYTPISPQNGFPFAHGARESLREPPFCGGPALRQSVRLRRTPNFE